MCVYGVFIQTTPGEHKAQYIRQKITQRLYLWGYGQHAVLLADTVAEI